MGKETANCLDEACELREEAVLEPACWCCLAAEGVTGEDLCWVRGCHQGISLYWLVAPLGKGQEHVSGSRELAILACVFPV